MKIEAVKETQSATRQRGGTGLIVGVDPSTKALGVAVLKLAGGKLVDAQRITPPSEATNYVDRVAWMAKDMAETLWDYIPEVVVVEIPSKHVAKKRHKGAGAGLAIYGYAVGVIWQSCCNAIHQITYTSSDKMQIVGIDAQEWTGGNSKASRARIIKAVYPEYKIEADPGGDVADAIGLAKWWADGERLREVQKGGER